MDDIIGNDELRGQLRELQGGEGPCKKSEKSLEWRYQNFLTEPLLTKKPTFWVLGSTEVENSYQGHGRYFKNETWY